MKLVSIIIPHYNGKELLYNCINSIYQNIQIENFEIIIVDNGSTDDSVQNIEQLFSDIVIITNETNVGYSGGCNIGAQNAKGKYLLFLNNDTEHSKEWVEKLVNFLCMSFLPRLTLFFFDKFLIVCFEPRYFLKSLKSFNDKIDIYR